MDQKYPPIKYGRCIVEIEDSYHYTGKFIIRCTTQSQRGRLDFLFDDQVEDMRKALKKARRRIFWVRFRRILFGI